MIYILIINFIGFLSNNYLCDLEFCLVVSSSLGVHFFFLPILSSFRSSVVATPDSQGPESRILLTIYDSGISLVQVLVARKYLLLLPLVKQFHRRHGSRQQRAVTSFRFHGTDGVHSRNPLPAEVEFLVASTFQTQSASVRQLRLHVF